MIFPSNNATKSYWIEAAESPLRDFRSTEYLPKEVDVVIIGSGYAGATTAYWLHKHTQHKTQKPSILMLEARDICGSSTGRNGGQLRPHAYSRYPVWATRFGPETAMDLIKHEMAHLAAFKELTKEEGIADESCLKIDETFDAAMTDEAWVRLKGAYESMKEDHGADNEVVKVCRLIEDSKAAQEFTQMKGCLGAVVHPAGQIWPYKFVHSLLRIVLAAGNFNVQAYTPVTSVSERSPSGWITVNTMRGHIQAKTVVHTTNRWTSNILPEFKNLILGDRSTLASLNAPEGFIKHTGAQHWDSSVNNYHCQLPPPYNSIIIGGARALLAHYPEKCCQNDDEDQQFEGVPDFFRSWPSSDVVGWPWEDSASFAKPLQEGGCWSGVDSVSIDSFPFVGAIPNREGQFMASGFTGHGMPRILLSTAHLVSLILEAADIEHIAHPLTKPYPEMPKPFYLTVERMTALKTLDPITKFEDFKKASMESAQKPFCNDARSSPRL